MKKAYITTPIYYVNDVPHIGHAYTSVMCDSLARLKRLDGQEVKFLTGTDEHGQKVEKSALARGKTPQQFCDEISLKFEEMADFLDVSYDDFIRTTENRHKKTVQIFWQKLQENGWIYKSIYEGWYAVRDEAFYNEDELVDGKAPTGAEVSWHKEESYFFRLSEFQDVLLKIYEEFEGFVAPESKKNEVISFVRGGKEYQKGALKDLSISRTSFKWGIPVPGDENHVVYVWLDALTNYLSALNYPDGEEFKDFWRSENSQKIHIVGKDILRFHAVYWPAFLIASKFKRGEIPSDLANLVDILPSQIFAHGWWTNEGEKISKSLGNVIDPFAEIEWLKSFGIEQELAIDYFRYFLAKEISFGSDGDYSRQRLIERVNSELANNIGNLAQRVLTMIYKNCDQKIPNSSEDLTNHPLYQISNQITTNVRGNLEEHHFGLFLFQVVSLSSQANEYLHQRAPWTLKKEGKIEEMNNVLYVSAEIVRRVAILLLAFMPKSANKMLDLLNVEGDKRSFANLGSKLEFGTKINEPTAIFSRLSSK